MQLGVDHGRETDEATDDGSARYAAHAMLQVVNSRFAEPHKPQRYEFRVQVRRNEPPEVVDHLIRRVRNELLQFGQLPFGLFHRLRIDMHCALLSWFWPRR